MTDEPGTEAATPAPLVDPALFDVLELALLGENRTLTRRDVARESGASVERLNALWRALGFTPAPSDDDVLYTEGDVEAVQLLDAVLDLGVIDLRSEMTVARSMGRSFARLAEWQLSELSGTLAPLEGTLDEEMINALVAQFLPVTERLQNYTWRRHLANAAARMLLNPGSGGESSVTSVGFADIVGFTRTSRRLTGDELGDLVETFESTVTQVISGHGGRVIKTIGDEVLFAADDPLIAARIALDLAEGHTTDDDFPEVRVGVAHGDVINRMGDVFGEVVNIASRLTSLARPGRVLMNASLAEQLAGHDDEFRVRRARTTAVKGYSRLETWSLRRPKPGEEQGSQPLEALEGIAEGIEGIAEGIAERIEHRRRRRHDDKHEGRSDH